MGGGFGLGNISGQVPVKIPAAPTLSWMSFSAITAVQALKKASPAFSF